MRRFLLAVLAVLVPLSVTAPASAELVWQQSFARTFYYLDTQGGYPTGPVETWVHNPTSGPRCAWGDQDQVVWSAWNTMEEGTTSSVSLCLIADYDDSGNVSTPIYPKAIAFRVLAPKDTLAVWLTNDVGDLWVGQPEPFSNNRTVWRTCVADPVADAANSPSPLSSYWPEVIGSNGGYGQIVWYTLHVQTTGRKLRDVSGDFEIHPGGPETDYSPRYIKDAICPVPDGF